MPNMKKVVAIIRINEIHLLTKRLNHEVYCSSGYRKLTNGKNFQTSSPQADQDLYFVQMHMLSFLKT